MKERIKIGILRFLATFPEYKKEEKDKELKVLVKELIVKIKESGLSLFYFSIFRTTRVRVDQPHCHISHNMIA